MRGRLLATLLIGIVVGGAAPVAERFDESGFRPLFDGHSLAGWHASAASTHSAASGNRSGGSWVVGDGAVTGTQDTEGNGGILVSDESFGDVEVALEARIDFGVDSGVFVRSTESGAAYQMTVDYFPGGSVGGLYGEALPGGLFIKNFEFDATPGSIHALSAAFPLPVDPADWARFWSPAGWNDLRVRITGNPPHVTTWINGVRFLDYVDDVRRLPDRGAIALQVHGGGNHVGELVRYRNIRVKTLD